jgi:microcystin-dependent protein
MAQVGINSANPSKAAVLDVADDQRGVLIPRLTRAERLAMKDIAEYAPLPNGLLVYDKNDDMFYYYNPDNSANGNENWQALSPFTFKDDRSNIVSGIPLRTAETHKSVRSIRLFENTNTAANRRLYVKGGVSISSGNTTPPGTDYGLYVQSTANFGSDLTTTGSVNVSGTINAKGTFPIGGIMIWSGSTGSIPNGYSLCNGSNGTPNLTDRFIVASGGGYNIGNTGGSNTVTLTNSQMPEHSHIISITKDTSLDGEHFHYEGQHAETGKGVGSYITASGDRNRGGDPGTVRYYTSKDGGHNHTVNVSGNTSNIGNANAHDNRPAYYALAYIQRKF